MMLHARRLLSALLIVCLTGVSVPMPAQAALLDTNQVLLNDPGADRARVADLLERAEVRASLVAYGVHPADVRARIAAMTDEEAAQLAANIHGLPAGGIDILSALLLVFLVLLVTDILGFTKVFPFTRPVR